MQELVSLLSYETTNHFRQDSCRGCGKEVKAIHYCQVCKQPIQFQCLSCKQHIDEQIHFGCKSGDVIKN